MKKKNSKLMAAKATIMAPIAKLFPAWALKFTTGSNPYAEKFQLSSEKEISYLLEHPKSAAWIGNRIWDFQTYTYMFGLKNKRPELFEAFVGNIYNGTLFDAAYQVAPEDAIKVQSYTLDANRVIKACNDNVNYLYILANSQPQSFTVGLVKRLAQNRQEAYFAYLLSKSRWEKLAELDVILFDEAKKNETAKSCLSFLLRQKNYNPNLSPEQLSSLGEDYQIWCQNAKIDYVAEKMLSPWKKNSLYTEIYALLNRLLQEVEASEKRNDTARDLLETLLGTDLYTKGVMELLDNGIALPKAFFCLRKEQEDLIEKNLNLCIMQKLEGKIFMSDFECFNETQKEKELIALAKDGILSNEMLEKASADVKQKLLDILEEQAQVQWFTPLMGYSITEDSIRTLKNYQQKGKLYGALQDLTFKDHRWVAAFVENKFYDEDHILKLMQSVFSGSVKYYIQNFGITQRQFEALLTGRNSSLAPEAKMYMK